MTTDADKRKATFEGGDKFIGHIDTVDKMYTAVIEDIAKSSFKGAGWEIDQKTTFRTDSIYVPFKLADNNQSLPKWLISSFDKNPGVTPLEAGTSLQEKILLPTKKTVGNVQYAWDGDDQLAYIDGVASAVFLQ